MNKFWDTLAKVVVPFIPPVFRVNRRTLDELPEIHQLFTFFNTILQFFTLKRICIAILWVSTLYVAERYGGGALFAILSCFYLIFRNLGDTADGKTLSAYSIFNPGATRMLGSLTADQFENEIRHRQVDDYYEQDDHPVGANDHQFADDELALQEERDLQRALELSLMHTMDTKKVKRRSVKSKRRN